MPSYLRSVRELVATEQSSHIKESPGAVSDPSDENPSNSSPPSVGQERHSADLVEPESTPANEARSEVEDGSESSSPSTGCSTSPDSSQSSDSASSYSSAGDHELKQLSPRPELDLPITPPVAQEIPSLEESAAPELDNIPEGVQDDHASSRRPAEAPGSRILPSGPATGPKHHLGWAPQPPRSYPTPVNRQAPALKSGNRFSQAPIRPPPVPARLSGTDPLRFQARPSQLGRKDTPSYDRDFQTVGPTENQPSGLEKQLDVTERAFRQHTRPILKETEPGSGDGQEGEGAVQRPAGEIPTAPGGGSQGQSASGKSRSSARKVNPLKFRPDMGYYDNEGNYHSSRRTLHRGADKFTHPLESSYPGDDRDDHEPGSPGVTIEGPSAGQRVQVAGSSGGSGGKMAPNAIPIPAHFIRIGDLLILQGRPCQVIRITTSSHTGQHRYLGVDLFTKQLHEESSYVSTPSPSVVMQNMYGPVFKQYRVLDVHQDGYVTAMTELGEIKQGLRLLDQSNLHGRLTDSFDNGRGSVRVLVISDGGQELAVDYKVMHGSRI